MRGMIVAAGLALASLSIGGCAFIGDDEDDKGATTGTPAGGSGDATTRSYAVSGFTGIVAAGSDSVEVTKGDAFAVTATGDSAVLDRLVIRVKDGALEIRRRSGNWSGTGSATIKVTMPALDSIVAAGSGDVTTDSLTGDEAEVTVAGSGTVRIDAVAVRQLDITVAGSGTVEATGTAEGIGANIAGSGSLAAPALTAQRADIDIAGSGSVTMAVTGTADVSTVGSGDVTLTGGATCTTSKMGGGAVNCS